MGQRINNAGNVVKNTASKVVKPVTNTASKVVKPVVQGARNAVNTMRGVNNANKVVKTVQGVNAATKLLELLVVKYSAHYHLPSRAGLLVTTLTKR